MSKLMIVFGDRDGSTHMVHADPYMYKQNKLEWRNHLRHMVLSTILYVRWSFAGLIWSHGGEATEN
jgi:hypothetical protein